MRRFSLWCPALAGLVVAVLFAGSTAFAHHSFGATYEVSKQVKLDGKIVQFVYRNPHSFVHVEAPDADGKDAAVGRRVGRHRAAADAGVKRDTLKVGDKVVIIGRPSRVPGEYRVLMVNLTRPSDGFHMGQECDRSRRLIPPGSLIASGLMKTSQVLDRLVFVCAHLRPRSLDAQRGRGGGGAPPASPRQAAPIDLTGYWVSPIIEDWKFRMVIPNKGVFDGVPLNPEGRKVGDELGSGGG